MFLLEQNKSTHLDFLQPCSTLGLRSQPLACKSCLISAEFAQSGKPRSCKQRLLPCKLLLAASGSAVGGAERSSLCCSVRPCSGALCCLLRPVVTCRHRNWGGCACSCLLRDASLPALRSRHLLCTAGSSSCLGADQMQCRGAKE